MKNCGIGDIFILDIENSENFTVNNFDIGNFTISVETNNLAVTNEDAGKFTDLNSLKNVVQQRV